MSEDPNVRREFVHDGKRYREDHHGSISESPEDPPGSTRHILRGKFALVEFSSRDRKPEVRLVLLGLEPENRKLVFDVEGWIGGELLVSAATPVKLWLAMDIPGGSRAMGEEGVK
jgi:hypothetical protein